MICVDVGNTKTAIGVFQGKDLSRKWRVSTDARKTADEYRLLLRHLLETESTPPDRTLILASVVPEATRQWSKLGTEMDFHVVNHLSPASFDIALPDPKILGADRIADAEAAVQLWGAPAIIVDAGTAMTFSAVSAQKKFIGGAILPGIGISMKALFSAAARLSEADVAPPETAIGNSTKRAIDSGMHYGYSAMINGMVEKFASEMGSPDVNVVATGGSIGWLAPFLRPGIRVDEDLTLKGLRMLGENLKRKAHA